MSEAIPYEIVVAGHPGAQLLRPFLDEFHVHRLAGETRLVGEVRDSAHLHGLVAHLTAMSVEIVAITRRPGSAPIATDTPDPRSSS